MDCGKALQTLHDALDGAAAAEDRAELDRHLADCAECAAAERSLHALQSAFRATPRVAAPAGFGAEVAARVPTPGARLLTLPRLLIPAAAAAALFVGAVLLSSRGDREVASAPASSPAPARALHVETEASDERKALDADDAIDAARRYGSQRPRAAEPAGEPTSPAEEIPLGAPEPPATAGAGPVAKSAAESSRDEADKTEEESAPGSTWEAAFGQPAGTRSSASIVVFRSEAQARAFLDDLAHAGLTARGGRADEPAAQDAGGKSKKAEGDEGHAPSKEPLERERQKGAEAAGTAGPATKPPPAPAAPSAGGGGGGGARTGADAAGDGATATRGGAPAPAAEDGKDVGALAGSVTGPRIVAYGVAADPTWTALAGRRGGWVVASAEPPADRVAAEKSSSRESELAAARIERYRRLLGSAARAQSGPAPAEQPGADAAGAAPAASEAPVSEPPKPESRAPGGGDTPATAVVALEDAFGSRVVIVVIVDESLPEANGRR